MTAIWNDASIAMLKKCFDEGDTCSTISGKISSAFGYVSRSAIIGKLHRLGFSRGNSWRKLNGSPKAKKQKRIKARKLAPLDAYAAIEIGDPDLVPDDQRCSILTLTATTCRYPYGHPGDATFFYCGAPICVGPYCAAHARLSYTMMPASEATKHERGSKVITSWV